MAKQKQTFHIDGMTCTSCEVIIERKISKVDGVVSVEVSNSTGICEVTTASGARFQRKDIAEILGDTEYKLIDESEVTEKSFNWAHLVKIGITVAILYVLASVFGIFSFDAQIGETLSYPAIFGIGLVASVSSCIAVVGGLVLTFTATVKRTNPNASKWQLMRAHLFFNGGRLISYFVLGGVVALIGSALAPSPRIMGLISLSAALVMIVLAFDLLGISGSKKWIPRMPKKWSHWIHDMAEREEWWIPFSLGGLTFFLPCGFTQSMQLYALTTGSFMDGGLTLLVFALGTVPALLGIGALASFTTSRGAAYRWFMLIAGSLVLLLGIYNVKSSMTLLGIDTRSIFSSASSKSASEATEVSDGVQVVNMAVDGIDYIPDRITIQKGVPVQWVVDGSGASGCTSILTIPSLKVFESLSRSGDTIIEFTPKETGKLPFTCGMGMSYGEFQVVEAQAKDAKINTAKDTAKGTVKDAEECDSDAQTCY
ncbi:MAG: sulfite exporter TauE/SafE family protein [bacterium]|nr:sulfite exporter TauE/SafE family protein [bacterium]